MVGGSLWRAAGTGLTAAVQVFKLPQCTVLVKYSSIIPTGRLVLNEFRLSSFIRPKGAIRWKPSFVNRRGSRNLGWSLDEAIPRAAVLTPVRDGGGQARKNEVSQDKSSTEQFFCGSGRGSLKARKS